MSDDEGTEPEDEQNPETELVFVCNKCNGKQFKTIALRDKHREWHRQQRLQKTNPGPASSKRRREGSVTASVLFAVKQIPKKPDQAAADDTSSRARSGRAVAQHLKGSYNYKKKYKGA